MKQANNFEEAVALFHEMVDSLKKAKTTADISRTERGAIQALQGIHYYAAYLGKDLKLAVQKADMRLRAEQQRRINQIINPELQAEPTKKMAETPSPIEYAQYKKLLSSAKKQFPSGSTIRNKKTGEKFRVGMHMEVLAMPELDGASGVAVTIFKDGPDREEYTFCNERIEVLLDEYELVEPTKKTTKKTARKKK